MGQLLQYDPVNNISCTTGDTCYKWRVITVGDTTSNTTITLQMDHNLVNTVAWASQEDYNDDTNYGTYGNTNKGPITALKALETATSTWDNSLKLNYTYNTSVAEYNYGTLSCANGACTVAGSQITSNSKARMITGEELATLTVAAGAAEGTTASDWTLTTQDQYYFSNTDVALGTWEEGTGSTELSWLIENTAVDDPEDNSSSATNNTYGDSNWGYWTLSPFNDMCPWYLSSYGTFTGDFSVDTDNIFGIRPVITIPKSILE